MQMDKGNMVRTIERLSDSLQSSAISCWRKQNTERQFVKYYEANDKSSCSEQFGFVISGAQKSLEHNVPDLKGRAPVRGQLEYIAKKIIEKVMVAKPRESTLGKFKEFGKVYEKDYIYENTSPGFQKSSNQDRHKTMLEHDPTYRKVQAEVQEMSKRHNTAHTIMKKTSLVAVNEKIQFGALFPGSIAGKFGLYTAGFAETMSNYCVENRVFLPNEYLVSNIAHLKRVLTQESDRKNLFDVNPKDYDVWEDQKVQEKVITMTEDLTEIGGKNRSQWIIFQPRGFVNGTDQDFLQDINVGFHIKFENESEKDQALFELFDASSIQEKRNNLVVHDSARLSPRCRNNRGTIPDDDPLFGSCGFFDQTSDDWSLDSGWAIQNRLVKGGEFEMLPFDNKTNEVDLSDRNLQKLYLQHFHEQDLGAPEDFDKKTAPEVFIKLKGSERREYSYGIPINFLDSHAMTHRLPDREAMQKKLPDYHISQKLEYKMTKPPRFLIGHNEARAFHSEQVKAGALKAVPKRYAVVLVLLFP